MTIEEAIKHAKEVATKKYAEGMLCHANPNDEYLDGCISCAKEHEQLAEWLKELLEYKKLGTLEEVEDAVGKQTAEKPRKVLGINGNTEYECGNCGESEFINELFNYCPWCGQKLDWSDENDD